MTDKVWTEIVRRIGVEGEGYFLSVGPWSEAPEMVSLYTEGEKNSNYYGRIDVALSPDQAMLLGQALIACADELKG